MDINFAYMEQGTKNIKDLPFRFQFKDQNGYVLVPTHLDQAIALLNNT